MFKRSTVAVLMLTGLVSTGLLPVQADAATTGPPIVPTHLKYPKGGTVARGAGIDAANQNAQLAETVPATVKPSWSNAPAVCPQSEETRASSISVTGRSTIVTEVGFGCSFVSAYATATGALNWRKSYQWAKSTTVAGGVAYVQHTDPQTSATLVDAISVKTGAIIWSAEQAATDYVESVGSGLVINSQYALTASTGQHAFTLPLASNVSTGGTSLIAGGVIYYNSQSAVQAFSSSGVSLWVRPKPSGAAVTGAGAGVASPALHDGLLYVRSSQETPSGKTLVIDPTTGTVVRTLPRSDTDWSFDGRVGFITVDGDYGVATAVKAVDLTTGAVYWTHLLPMNGQFPFEPSSAPLVENGLVWFTQASDTMSPSETIALDEVTGSVKTDMFDTCAMSQSNLVVAQHRLFVGSGCGVRVFQPTTKQAPVVPTAGEMLKDPSFERGPGAWTALGAGVVTPSSTAHTGSRSITMTPTSSTQGTVGFAQSSLITKAVRHSSYSASCWIRPSKAGMTVGMQFADWVAGKPDKGLPRGSEVPSLAVGTWTHMATRGYASEDGDTLALQIYAINASKTGGTLTLDDCSVTKQVG